MTFRSFRSLKDLVCWRLMTNRFIRRPITPFHGYIVTSMISSWMIINITGGFTHKRRREYNTSRAIIVCKAIYSYFRSTGLAEVIDSVTTLFEKLCTSKGVEFGTKSTHFEKQNIEYQILHGSLFKKKEKELISSNVLSTFLLINLVGLNKIVCIMQIKTISAYILSAFFFTHVF